MALSFFKDEKDKKKYLEDLYAQQEENRKAEQARVQEATKDVDWLSASKLPSYYLGQNPAETESEFEKFLGNVAFGTRYDEMRDSTWNQIVAKYNDEVYKASDSYRKKQEEEQARQQALKELQEKQKQEEEARMKEWAKSMNIPTPTQNLPMPTQSNGNSMENVRKAKQEQTKQEIENAREEMKKTARLATPEEAEAIKEAVKNDSWLKAPDNFDDGYQFGDVTGAVLSSAGDLFMQVVKGVGNVGNGISNWLSYMTADIAEANGNKEWADRIRRNVENSPEFGEDEITSQWYKNINKNSIFGNKSDSIGQGIGNVGINSAIAIATGGQSLPATLATSGVTFTSAYGNARKEAVKSGATNEEAKTYANISAGGEMISEWLFAGLGKGTKALGYGGKGLSSLDDQLAKKASGMFKSQLAKNFTEFAIKSSAEGVEEVVSGITDGLGKKLTYEKDKDLGKILEDEKLFDQFVSGTVTSAFAQSSSLYQTTKSGQDFISNLNSKETQVYEDAISDKQMELKKQNAINEAYNEEIKGKDYTEAEKQKVRQEVTEKVENGEIALKKLSKEEVKQSEEYADNAIELYRRQELSKNADTYYESARKYNIDTNNQAVQAIQRFGENRGLQIEYNPEIFRNSNEEAVWVDDGNARHIYINPSVDNQTALQKLVTHEMFHDTIGSKPHTKLTDLVMNKLMQDSKYEANRQSVVNAYQEQLNAIEQQGINQGLTSEQIQAQQNALINEEMTAKYLGENLGNQEFVNEMINSTEKSTVEKIIDWIDNRIQQLKNVVTGNKEAEYWRSIRENITKAYNAKYQGTENAYFNKNAELPIKESKQALEERFKNLTGDSIMQADTKLAGIELRNNQRENGNLDGELEANPYNEEAMQIYNKYKNSRKSSQYLYHSTSKDNIKSILEKGLTTGNKQNQEGVSSKNNIYLSATEELAQSFAPQDNVTLRINPKAKLENLSNDLLGGEGSYTITNNIPADMLQVKENGKWVNLTESKLAETKAPQNNYGVNLEKNTYLDYNNIERKIPQEIVPYIQADNNKGKYLKYSQSEEFFRLTEKEMAKAVAVSSQQAIEDASVGLDFGSAIDDNRIYYYDIYDTDGKYFGITNYEDIDTEYKEIINDGFKEENFNSIKEQIDSEGARQSILPINSDAIENSRTNKSDATMVTKQSESEEGQDSSSIISNKQSIENSEKSSFNLPIKERTIQGLENYTVEEVKSGIKADIQNILEENGIDDVNIVDLDIHGSRLRGTANNNSDLDVVVQYDGDIREDTLFDILNENPIEIDGVKVDINPIQENLQDYMKRSNEYDQEVKNKLKETENETNLSTTDDQGRTLTKEQQRFFKDSKVRDNNGNLMELYHGGTAINEFTKGNGEQGQGFYFTDDLDYAEHYADSDEEGHVTKAYLNIKNPLEQLNNNNIEKLSKFIDYISENYDISKEQVTKMMKDEDWTALIGEQVALKEGHTYQEVADFLGWDVEDLDIEDPNFKQYLAESAWNETLNKKARELGYDGIISRIYNDSAEGLEYIAFNSNQIKNVDNTNPTESNDIRYSKKSDTYDDYLKENSINKDVETTNDGKNLLALHNLSADKLQQVLDLGGFPVPSIAITNPNIVDHNQFGDISVVFNKDTINPENRSNEVYDRDVWSPTVPEIHYDINNDNIKKYITKGLNIDRKDSIVSHAVLNYLYEQNLSEHINRYGIETTLQQLKDSKELQYLYKRSQDPDYKPQTKNKDYSNYHTNETLQRFVDNFNKNHDMSLSDFFYHYINYGDMELTQQEKTQLVNEMKEAIRPEIQEYFDQYNSTQDKKPTQKQIDKYIQEELDSEMEQYSKYYDFLYNASQLEKNGINNQVIDEDATLEKISNDIDKKEYDKWIDDTFGKMFNEATKGIRNDKDFYTPSGNRRSFNQLYDKYNLTNLVKAMSKKSTKGGQETSIFGTGFGRISAQTANKFKSIQDIKNNESRIMTRQQAEEIIRPISESLFEKVDNLVDYYTRKDYKSEHVNRMQGIDITSELIEDFAGGKLTKERLKKVLGEYNYYDMNKIPDTLLEGIVNDLKEVSKLPTDYFEAKPQRAVGFDEIDAIILPSNTNAELKQQLADKGIKTIEYDSSDENAKGDILKALDEYKFNKKATSFDEYLKENSINTGKTTTIKDVLLPIQKKAEANKTTLPVNKEVAKKSNNNQILDNAKKFLNEDYSKDLTADMFEGLSEADLKDGLKQLYQAQLNEELSIGNYKEDASRKRTYMKYKNANTQYNEKILNNALDAVKANRNGKRTMDQWLNVAKQIGLNSENLTAQQLQDLAYGSWFDLKPNTKDSRTYYDNVAKENLPYRKFISDDWVNTIYDNAKQVKLNQFEQALNKQEKVLPTKKVEKVEAPVAEVTQRKGTQPKAQPVEATQQEEVKLPVAENTQGESINWNEMTRPENNKKFRKHYQSIIESSNTTAEAKTVAKELMGLDTYIPDSNKSQLQRADNLIQQIGADEALSGLKLKTLNNERITATDIAIGERLIEYYSKTGNREGLQQAIENTALLGTQAGQTVQALAILNHQTPTGQVAWIQRSVDKTNAELQEKYGKKGKKAPQFEFTSEMQEKILNTESQEEMFKAIDEVYKELGQQVPKSHAEQLDEWRYFSMLANIKTHGRNAIGNFFMHGIQRAKDKIAGGIEDVVATFNPDMERMHTLRRIDKKTKAFAKQDLQNMDVKTMLGENENKYNPQSRLQSARRTFKSDILENTLGKLFNVNSRALEAEDSVGLKAMYKKALGEYLTANRIDVDNMTDAQLAKARQYAVQASKEATFHQASNLATLMNQLGRKSNIGKFALDAVVPFKKTPINVAKTGIEYSPVGLVKSAVYDLPKLRKGQITANQYIDHVSRGVTGTALTLIGYALAQAGILKAKGEDDEKKEKYDQEQGKQQYSLQIGDVTVSLDWLSPSAVPMFIGAEISEQFNGMKNEKKTGGNESDLDKAVKSVAKIANAMSDAMNPISEMSMVQGITSVLSSYNKENALGDMFTNAGKSYVGQYVPTLLGQIARTTDEYERTTKSTKTGTLEKAVDQLGNQIKSKIPGLRQTLPVKTDIWGQEVKQTENLPLRAFNNFINPATVKEITSDDKVNKSLNELYDRTGSSSVLPSAIDKTYTIQGTTYRMTNDEYAKYSKKYGETAHKLLDNLTSSSDFKKLNDTQKTKAIEEVYSYAKEKNKIEYAKDNKIDGVKPSTDYKVLEQLGDKTATAYLSYKGKTSGMTKDKEKLQVLLDSDYTGLQKRKIYEYSVGKEDELFKYASELNIDEYLKYKLANIQGTKNQYGETISGSKKKAVLNYVNNNISGYNNRLWIIGQDYKLSRKQQEDLARYINQSDEAIEIFKLFKNNFKVDSNGKVYYK